MTHTAWDAGEPPDEPLLMDTGATFHARWDDTGGVDCEASVTSTQGDPVLSSTACTT